MKWELYLQTNTCIILNCIIFYFILFYYNAYILYYNSYYYTINTITNYYINYDNTHSTTRFTYHEQISSNVFKRKKEGPGFKFLCIETRKDFSQLIDG